MSELLTIDQMKTVLSRMRDQLSFHHFLLENGTLKKPIYFYGVMPDPDESACIGVTAKEGILYFCFDGN